MPYTVWLTVTSLTPSPPTLPPFIVHQPHWPLCCFLNLFSTLVSQSLCKYYSLCLQHLPPDLCKSYTLTSFRSLLKCHFLRETSLATLKQHLPSHILFPLIYFLFLCSTSHPQSDLYSLIYIFLLSLLHWTVGFLRAGLSSVLFAAVSQYLE